MNLSNGVPDAVPGETKAKRNAGQGLSETPLTVDSVPNDGCPV